MNHHCVVPFQLSDGAFGRMQRMLSRHLDRTCRMQSRRIEENYADDGFACFEAQREKARRPRARPFPRCNRDAPISNEFLAMPQAVRIFSISNRVLTAFKSRIHPSEGASVA